MVDATKHFAVCVLNPDDNSGVSAVCKMSQVEGEKVQITAEFKGLTEGQHGFHIHQFGKLKALYFNIIIHILFYNSGNLTEGCKTAGPHYNPGGKTHGGPTSEVRHNGDLGNVVAGADGNASYSHQDTEVMLYGPNSCIGRAMVCHKDVDDLGQGGHELSPTTGNAGARVACGVIGLSAAW